MATLATVRNEAGAEKIRLQCALPSSRNPTRRWLYQSRRKWIIRAAGRFFTPGRGTAMDAGSGCGFLLDDLATFFDTVIAVDIQPFFLHYAARRTTESRQACFCAGDLRALPVAGDSMDLVICSEVLEHVRDGEPCLREIGRVLKPGGLAIVSTPQPFSLLEMAARLALSPLFLPLVERIYGEPVGPLGHINLRSMRRWRKTLADCGFRILETHRSGLYLPVLAEMFPDRARNAAGWLNARLSATPLAFLLWTQFFVAVKPDLPQAEAEQEKSGRDQAG